LAAHYGAGQPPVAEPGLGASLLYFRQCQRVSFHHASCVRLIILGWRVERRRGCKGARRVKHPGYHQCSSSHACLLISAMQARLHHSAPAQNGALGLGDMAIISKKPAMKPVNVHRNVRVGAFMRHRQSGPCAQPTGRRVPVSPSIGMGRSCKTTRQYRTAQAC
jgi:hypothetical protein